MNDDLTKNTAISDDNTDVVTTSNSTVHQVEIISVKDVSLGNRVQAEATMRALAEAGLDLELAAKGLEEGHGHDVDRMTTHQPFTDMEGKIGGIEVSSNSVAAWQLGEKIALGPGTSQPDPTSGKALVPLSSGVELEKIEQFIEEDMGSKRIKMVVIIGTKISGELEEGNK